MRNWLKTAAVLGAALVMTLAFSVCALAADRTVTVDVNGADVTFDQPPVIENGRTLVPMRAILEAMNAEVSWDAATRTVGVDWGYDSLSLQIGSRYIRMGDGRTITIDVPAKILNGRTLIPLRAISESMGADVYWYAESYHVSITKTWDAYYVTSVEDMIPLIGNNVRICLAPGTYDLSKWTAKHANGSTGNRYVSVNKVFDGEELVISDVDNFSIVAANSGQKTELVVSPRYADVLSFADCGEIDLVGLTLGHTPTGICAGDVLRYNNCALVYLKDMDLYGCGAYGIVANGIYQLAMIDSVIHDCSYGIMEMTDCNYNVFNDCTFRNCREFAQLTFRKGSTAEFKRCTFANNQGYFLAGDDTSYVTFAGCTLDAQARYDLESSPLYGTNVFVY